MIRVAIDATFIRAGHVGGAEQMVLNLSAGLTEAETTVDVFVRKGEWRGPQVSEIHELPSSLNRFLAGTISAVSSRRDCDAFIGSNYFVPPMLGRGRVICGVIHDLQYVWYPQFFSRRKRYWLRAAHSVTLRSADVVVAISDAVRNDLLEVHGDKYRRKIVVIPNAVSWDRFDRRSLEFPTYPYLLTVAAHYPHKNLATLVKSFGLLKSKREMIDLRLVIVGQGHSNLVSTDGHDLLAGAVAESKYPRDIILPGLVSDDELAMWYKSALAFCLPSLFEGFGMPAVEAIGLGLPTITTRCGALPETTLGLATYVNDPLNVKELAALLVEVVQNREGYVPQSTDIEQIRAKYDPLRIGNLYLEALDQTAQTH